MRARRWSDHDKYLGPFTFAFDRRGYKPLAVVISSAGDDEDDRCELRLSGFGLTFITALPAIIRPYREKVTAKYWDAATVERMGRDWYYQVDRRKFGFSYAEGYLQIFRGRVTHDSSTDRTKGWFPPWTQWRFIRHSFFDLAGKHFWTQFEKDREPGVSNIEEMLDAQGRCPSAVFLFEDFDGERITATTYIEEREWRLGAGRFAWLSLFRKPRITRSLKIDFSDETGRRKGSWKGGTLGHSIELQPEELHNSAFRRYCVEHGMKFICQVDATSGGGRAKTMVRVDDRWFDAADFACA